MLRNFIFSLLVLLVGAATVSAQDLPIGDLLQPHVNAGQIPGVVTVVATKDKILQIDALGFADLETKRPMTADTLFYMASQTKTVTAIAVMVLVEENKLSLDEPITTYLPELKDLWVVSEQSDSRKVLVLPERPITLRMLLSHTSGMIFNSLLHKKFGNDFLPLSKTLVCAVMTPLQHQPGTAYLYSNMGIDMGAMVVERVSKMPFDQFLEKRLFEPLGMKETTFRPTRRQVDRIAKTYGWNKKEKRLFESKLATLSYPLDDPDLHFPRGGGGLFSTPNDWVRIYQMLAGEGTFEGRKILSPESVREIRTKQTGELPNSYGLGVKIEGDRFGHGGAHGTNSLLDTKTGRIGQYFIQQTGLPKADEARRTFFKAALQ